MNASPATVAQTMKARKSQRVPVKPVYTTSTGDKPRVARMRAEAAQKAPCPEVQNFGEHVLSVVYADLPGDRSVGNCICGQYIDTGTWDERNAE